SAPRPDERLTCTFLNVGHGLAVIVELPDGRALLYDAGRLGSPDQAARAVSGALWSQGRRRVHGAIVSHADADHFNALPSLFQKFAFDVVYLAPSFHRDDGGATRSLFEALTAARVPTRPLVAEDGIALAHGVAIRVLQPPAEGVFGEDNANSLVVAIEYAGRRILLTGDLEEAGLDRLLAMPPLACDVLLAPHHGSTNTLVEPLAEWASPHYVVVSGDPAKTGTHTASRYRENGCRVLTTGEVGAVRATITAGGLSLETFGPAGDLLDADQPEPERESDPPASESRLAAASD
ncbi:MAG TPA: MBL fold metallo-hydrolase, partial [Pirellulales bacterium]